MNASAKMRASMLRRSAIIPVLVDVTAPIKCQTRFFRESIQVSDGERRRVIQTLNFLEYRVRREMEESSLPSPTKEYSLESSAIEVQTSRMSQVGRMFTIFPYKDMNWIVTMLFVIGSIAFVINAGLGLFPLLDESLGFETLPTIALPVTIMIGACMFITGGVLGVFAAFNADRGIIEKPDVKSIDGSSPAIYRPALIGSEAWIWIPSAADVASLLRTAPFVAGLVLLSGGVILSTSAVASIPGILDPMNLFLTQALVFTPQVIGGSLFFVANLALVMETQERWASDWQGAAWNALASAGFVITGILLLGDKILEASVVSFVASFSFLIGSVLQWYSLMEYHATPWAA